MSRKVAVSETRFHRGVRALVVFGALWSPTMIAFAQTSGDEEHVALKADAEQHFREHVAPFIKTYCLSCHSSKRPTEAGLNFTPALRTPAHPAFSQPWKKATARVKAHDMPPDYATKQPDDAERQMFVEWLAKVKFLSPQDPGLFVIRRLTKTEYGNTLHDLLGVEPSIASDLPDEVSGEGYLNSLSPLQLEQYLAIAEKALNAVLAPENAEPTDTQRRLFGELPPAETEYRAAAREVARSLAKKAYRRPPSLAEIDVLLAVFDLGRQNKLSYSASLRLMLKAILVSPQFLFITPATEAPADAGIVPLDDYQLASRLSYFLWATMPDEELLALADRGRLSEPPVLSAQVKRLLDDPRSRALFDGFGAQWLGLHNLAGMTFDPEQFPQMTGSLRFAMYEEARLFFDSIVRENRSVMMFVEGDYTFLNEPLAAIYGVPAAVKGAALRRVRLSDENRGGILAMPGVLAATSFPNRTSPVKRGVWVLEQVLGEQVPSPPPDVPALEKQDQKSIASLTLRQRTELHRTDAVCANCHQMLDPLGFGLENFDAIGRWRDHEENGAKIDAAGELPGGKHFSSPKELKAIIAERRDDFSRNLAERLLAYALCRRLEGYDEIVVEGLMRQVAADDYRMQTLIRSVVTSYPFTHRRIPETPIPETRIPEQGKPQ
jgi:hypothetical protein